MKAELNRVTLVGIDCVDLGRLVDAAKQSIKHCNFAAVKLLSSLDSEAFTKDPELSGVEFVKIEPVNSLQQYSYFVIKELDKYIDTDFCLVIQHDGFVLNPEAWTDEFYNYDYIGAPWFKYAADNVGNGGFSLRSKTLLSLLRNDEIVIYNMFEKYVPEDEFICRLMSKYLKSKGIKYAPESLAKKFSKENGKWDGSFGFHDPNVTNIAKHNGSIPRSDKTALHSGDMGDVIYSIPTMQHLGVKNIILNPMPFYGTKMEEKLCGLIKPLLEHQGFKVEITSEFKRAFIDYDFDQFRNRENDLVWTHLAHTQAKTFDILDDVNFSLPWFTVNYPARVADVVINRTRRYNNMQFDWFYLLNDIKAKIVFTGTKDEYDYFCKSTMLRNVSYYPTKNLHELAKVIAGAKVFIGNQSTPYAIAEGLKQNRIQETCDYVPNCMALSDNGIDVKNRNDLYFAKAKLHDWLGLPFNSTAQIPKKIMLYTTAYMDNEYSYTRMRNWLAFYTKHKQRLGISHIVLIDDCSPVEWIDKLKAEMNIKPLLMEYRKLENGEGTILTIPANLSPDQPNWVRFPNRLGRPFLECFPGWWRSYSFGSELAHIHEFDKFIFIESDTYLLSDRLFQFLKNAESGYGSLWSPVSNYRESCIQWCMRSEYYKVRKYWMNGSHTMLKFWQGVNLHQTQYLPEQILPFNNDLDVVRHFRGDRYGDDHYSEIPENIELDFICNTTDISLNGIFHKKEPEKLKVLSSMLAKV